MNKFVCRRFFIVTTEQWGILFPFGIKNHQNAFYPDTAYETRRKNRIARGYFRKSYAQKLSTRNDDMRIAIFAYGPKTLLEKHKKTSA